VREFTHPGTVHVDPTTNLTEIIFVHATENPDRVVFSRRVGGEFEPITSKEFATAVRGIAAGLIAGGVQPGDRIALMSRTRFEWTLCDYAIWSAGAVTVPIYETSSQEQVAWILEDSGAVLALVETEEYVAAVAAASEHTPQLRGTFCIDSGGLDKLTAAGGDISDEALEERRRAVGTGDLATVIYTSGTTGRPKGCELTHGNLVFEIAATTQSMPEVFTDDAATLLFLPLAHVLARVIQCVCVHRQVRLGYSPSVKDLVEDLGTFQPTFILSVPRVFEKIYNTARQTAHGTGGGGRLDQVGGTVKGAIFDAAESTAIAYSEALERGNVSTILGAKHALFDRLVYSKVRERLGGRTTASVSGGAPLGARLGHFFRGIGLTIYEGYGLTESTAAATVNVPGALKIGTVGRPITGTTVRIADDGEILLGGGNIFGAYWQNEQATQDALVDGFLRTGDLGELDDEGFLRITGRKKEIIVTAGGKNVAPAVLEDRLRAHPLVSQCIVVGDQRPFIGALITLDPDELRTWNAAHGKPDSCGAEDLVDDPALHADLQKAVDSANQAVSKAESIRNFLVLPVDFTQENGCLTPSLKVKRNVVMGKFSASVEALYTR
jgi:long-chain acyl-CoA synthetase